MKRMLINATQQEELRVALVDGQRLYDLFFAPDVVTSHPAIGAGGLMRRKRLIRPTAHYQVYMLVLAHVTQLLQTTLQTFIHRSFDTHHLTGPRMSKLQRCSVQEQAI